MFLFCLHRTFVCRQFLTGISDQFSAVFFSHFLLQKLNKKIVKNQNNAQKLNKNKNIYLLWRDQDVTLTIYSIKYQKMDTEMIVVDSDSESGANEEPPKQSSVEKKPGEVEQMEVLNIKTDES